MNILSFFRKTELVSPYTQTAYFYDRMMDHVDYCAWAKYIDIVFKQYGKRISRVVDGGCGTGSLIVYLEELGYKAFGFDLSLAMVRKAKQKKPGRFWQCDLRDISLSGGCDAFLCLYDSLHYLDLYEILDLFKQVRSILTERGLFIFDVVTEKHVRKYWGRYSERNQSDGRIFFRKSWYNRKKKVQNTLFHVFNKTESKVYKEHHCQKIYTLDELTQAAEKCGFRILGKLMDFTLNPGDEKSGRIHFVLQQEGM